MFRAENIRFRYNAEWVLRGLSFNVAPGSFVGLLGPNGSGKTTLLRTLLGDLCPDEGRVFLKDRDLGVWPQRERARVVATVPQETHFTYPFSVLEIVLMGRAPHTAWMGFDRPDDIGIARRALDRTGLLDRADRPIQELSGGERQLVLIARALSQQPEVLLLDEPTAHLDLSHQLRIYGLLRELNRSDGLTLVSVSHDLNLAAQYCDRLLLMNGGRIEADGDPVDVLNEAAIERVYGCDTLVDAHPVTGRPRITLIPGASTRSVKE